MVSKVNYLIYPISQKHLTTYYFDLFSESQKVILDSIPKILSIEFKYPIDRKIPIVNHLKVTVEDSNKEIRETYVIKPNST